MSVKIMSDVFQHSKTEGNTRLVLLCLADCANDEGACWPSIRKLCEKANLSEPMTKKHLNFLIAAGVVKRDEREDHSGRQTSNFYTIDIMKIGNDEITPDVVNRIVPPSRRKKFERLTLVSGVGGNTGHAGEGVTGGMLSYMNSKNEPLIESSSDSATATSEGIGFECNEDLFPTAMVAESPSAPAPPTKRVPRKPRLVDDAFIAALKKLNPDKDVDTELKKARTWLVGHPERKLTRPFFSSWINRAKPINPDDEYKCDDFKL